MVPCTCATTSPGFREGQAVNVSLASGAVKPGIVFGAYRALPLATRQETNRQLYVVRLTGSEEILVGVKDEQLSRRTQEKSAGWRKKIDLMNSGEYLQLLSRARAATKVQIPSIVPVSGEQSRVRVGCMYRLTGELDSYIGRLQNRTSSELAHQGAKIYEHALAKADRISFSTAEQAALEACLKKSSTAKPQRLGAVVESKKSAEADGSSESAQKKRHSGKERNRSAMRGRSVAKDSTLAWKEVPAAQFLGVSDDLRKFNFAGLSAECSILFDQVIQQVSLNASLIKGRRELEREVRYQRLQRLRKADAVATHGYLPLSEWRTHLISKDIAVLDEQQLRLDAYEHATSLLREDNRTMAAQHEDYDLARYLALASI